MKADCVRKVANWSTVKPYHKFEKPTFNAEMFKADMDVYSPKLKKLIEKIRELDNEDMRKEGRLYKHFIFSDVKQGGYGSKIITSALIAEGMKLVYNDKLKLQSNTQLLETRGNNFALLCSTGVYDSNITVELKKSILGKYNERPSNIYGDLIRIIVMDSGYKEGIDLFDVKYVHIYEPQTSRADEKQVIGRGTRTCGQRGLDFKPNNGWTLEVYVYDVDIPSDIANILDAKTLFELYVKHSNIDLRKIAFANVLERMAIVGSVDYELNRNIHTFKVTGDEVDINMIFDNHFGGDIYEGGSIEGFCTSKCGLRATKAVPFNTVKLTVAYIAMGRRLTRKFETGKELRKYLCKLMRKDEYYCATLHDMQDNIREFIIKHADEFIRVLHMRSRNKISSKLPKRYASLIRRLIKTFVPNILKNVRTPEPLVSPDPNSPSPSPSPSPLPLPAPSPYASPSPSPLPLPLPAPSPSPYETPDNQPENNIKGPDYRTYPIKEAYGFLATRKFIRDHFMMFKWDRVELVNMCGTNGGASTIMKYTPTQDFIRHYFTPKSNEKGVLLYHSVGVGKTCSAIATATTSFEKEGYTILWVTRTTLKSDIWKNMFDQVCSVAIADKIRKREKIPTDSSERMRLLSKSWSIRPLSYKQFSNLVSGTNSLYQDLVKKNGKEDPLRKTLLIIDEAHKLYGGTDLSSVERPNMEKLESSIQHSYDVSGSDSVRVMLMTATPYTNDPMELIKLVNLLKVKEHHIPDTFESFSETYLNDEGTFTKKGHRQFLDDISGYISYLNREQDARQFAQPVIMHVHVPISIQSIEYNVNNDDTILSELQNLQEQKSTEIKEIKDRHKKVVQEEKARCKDLQKKEKTECLQNVKQTIENMKLELEAELSKLKKEVEEIKKEIKTVKDASRKKKKDMKDDPSQYSTLLSKCNDVQANSSKTKRSKKNDTEEDE